MKGYLEKNEKVVYVTTEKSPSEIRKRMKELGVDLATYESGSFLFVDIFTRAVGPKDDKVLYVDNPANLNMVSVRLTEATNTLGKPARIIFDSLSTFFLHAPEGEIRRFFESINSKVKMDYGFAFYTLHSEMHDEKVVTALKAIVDAVLEMKLEEDPRLKKKFRVLFAKGIHYAQGWAEFRITKDGIEFLTIGETPVHGVEAEGKRELPHKVTALLLLLLVGIALFQMFGNDKEVPVIETSFVETGTFPAPEPTTTSQPITAAPPLTTAQTTTTPPTTLPSETPPPTPPLVEYRLDGMEDAGKWFPMEGSSVILDITESTEFSKVDKSLKVSVKILGTGETFAGVGLLTPNLTGYDGLTLWSYVLEPVAGGGRLGMIIKEKDGSDYWYLSMRSLKIDGWVKDTIPFSALRLRPGGDNFDENNQLDLGQAEVLLITLTGFGPTTSIGTYSVYLDELNLFRYQNASK